MQAGVDGQSQVDSGARPRIGILLGPLGDLNTSALRFLILHLNTLQSAVEFEILPAPPSDPLWDLLASKIPVDRAETERIAAGFIGRYRDHWQHLLSTYGLSESFPHTVIIL